MEPFEPGSLSGTRPSAEYDQAASRLERERANASPGTGAPTAHVDADPSPKIHSDVTWQLPGSGKLSQFCDRQTQSVNRRAPHRHRHSLDQGPASL